MGTGGGGGGGGGGRLENFHMPTVFLYAAPAANNFFGVRLRLLANTFFTCIQFISARKSASMSMQLLMESLWY